MDMIEIVNDYGEWVAYLDNSEICRRQTLSGLLEYLKVHADELEYKITIKF